jgi:hypothetical protein
MSQDLEGAAGIVKGPLGVVAAIVSITGSVMALSDAGHALLGSVAFVVFLAYAFTDLCRWWNEDRWVMVFDPIAILAATYWWVGFMALHGIPVRPLLPEHLYPTNPIYLVLAVIIAIYIIWDIIDTRQQNYWDQKALDGGALSMLVALGFAVFQTLRAGSAG